jgi:hypothetical protein
LTKQNSKKKFRGEYWVVDSDEGSCAIMNGKTTTWKPDNDKMMGIMRSINIMNRNWVADNDKMMGKEIYYYEPQLGC